MTAMYLTDLGHNVVEAGNAEAASAMVHSMPSLDIVITDLAMPGLGGLQLAERLRSERPELPILFITGRADLVEAAGYPALSKPFPLANLASAIWQALAAPPRKAE